MKYASIKNPDLKSTADLIVLSHERRNIIMLLPSTYQAALKLAKQLFGLSVNDKIVLQAYELMGCETTFVEIHESAWASLSSILGRVYVKVLPAAAPEAPGENADVEMPDSVLKDVLSSNRERQPESYAQDPITLSSSSQSDVLKASAHVGPSRHINESSQSKQASPQSKGKTPVRRFRPRILSEAQEAENGDEEGLQKDDTFEHESGVARGKRKSPSFRRSNEMNDLQEGHSTANQNRSQVDGQPLKVKKELGSIPKDQAEENSRQRSPRKRPRLSAQDDVKADLNANFLVTIEFGEDPELDDFRRSIFKVKGKHSVGKVLSMACQTFNIEREDAQSAHLVMIVEDEEDGEAIEHRFECANNATMAQAGAYAEARFVIIIGNDEE